MTLQECYQNLDGNFDDVIGRLRSERLVQKFVLKFTEDKSYELLLNSLAEKNAQEAFRAAHTIKGMCQNLSFTRLEKSSTALTELLRGGDLNVDAALLERVKEDYALTVKAIEQYRESLNA